MRCTPCSIAEEIKYVEKVLSRMLILSIIGYALGYGLAIYGYVNWYKKIQVYQDMMLRQSAEDATTKRER